MLIVVFHYHGGINGEKGTNFGASSGLVTYTCMATFRIGCAAASGSHTRPLKRAIALHGHSS
jgi:hypothetical protein